VRPIPKSALRRAANEALAEFGIAAKRLTELANRHNHVFRVDAASGERFALRIQNDLLSDAEVRLQVGWLQSLAKHSAVVVPLPMHTVDGEPFALVECGHGRRRAMLLCWVPGRLLRRRGDDVYRSAARMIAQLHQHAESYRIPRGRSCRRLDGDWLFGERFFPRATRAGKKLSASQRKIAATAERFVRDSMATLDDGKRRFGLIHADLNLDNIVFHQGQPSPIDFDEFGMGWYLFDLAELIRTSVRPDNWRERKQLAVTAYTAARSLDDAELHAFDAFIVATFAQYLNWAFLHARSARDLRWVGFCLDVIRAVVRE
jgi:Ser/Thr protein kinase RdoA (MazF antagonist)